MKNLIFPYRTLDCALSLSLSRVHIDGNCARSTLVIPEAQLINLFEERSAWQRVSFEASVVTDRGHLELFEDHHGQVSLTLVTLCTPANNRQTIHLERSELDRALWSGNIELDRDNFHGRSVVRALLTATVDGMPHRTVAISNDWVVHFDAPASLRLSGTLKVSWCDFKMENSPLLTKQFPDSSHVVDLAKPLPEVLLNSSFEGLEPLLRDRKDRSVPEQVMHDMQRMSIARSVWMALLGDAIAAIKEGEDGQEPEWPDSEWQAEVLRRILPEIEKSKSERELLQLAADDWRTHPGSAEFLSRAEAVIGELINANKSLRKSVQALAKGGLGE